MSRLIGTAVVVWVVAALAILSPPSIVKGQVPMTGAGLGAPSSGFSPSCSQSSTFLAAATGVILTADKTNYDTLICGLQTDGNLAGLDVLYIWAAPTQTNAALINLANPGTFNGTTHGTVSFSAYNGYTGDATSFYVDSGMTISSASSPNFTLNNATLGAYVLTNVTDGGSSFGASGSLTSSEAQLNNGGNYRYFLNSNNQGGGTSSGTQGSWNLTRTSGVLQSLFQNSNETAVSSQADTTGDVPNVSMTFFSWNVGSQINFTGAKMAAGWIGKGVSAVNSCKINNRINTYMASLATPINVYSNSAC